jgi:hypothetical protein
MQSQLTALRPGQGARPLVHSAELLEPSPTSVGANLRAKLLPSTPSSMSMGSTLMVPGSMALDQLKRHAGGAVRWEAGRLRT